MSSAHAISDIIKSDIVKKRDLNCAEGVLYAANQGLGLGLDANSLKLAAGFGGGLGIGHLCGAFSGAIMVLGRLYVKDRAHESTRIKEIEQRFLAAVEKEFGGLMCTPLKEKYRDPEWGCKSIILKTAEILEELIASEQRPT